MPDTYNIPTFDTSLPEAPTYKAPTMGANPYSGTQYQGVAEAYRNYLGRNPESDAVVKQWYQNPNYAVGIGNSLEAQTTGRARAEINPLIDSQQQLAYDTIAQQRQQAQNQLGALGTQYQGEFAGLEFGKNQQITSLDQLLESLRGDTEYNANQLQSKFQPAYQNAINMANRRGLLDSSISLGLINQGYQPIQTALGELYRTSNQKMTEAQQNKQNILSKYGFDYQQLVSQREQEAKALRDNLALITAQKQAEAAQLEATRNAQIYARSGALKDNQNQYGLQQQGVQLSRDQLAEQQRQFNLNYALQQAAANRL